MGGGSTRRLSTECATWVRVVSEKTRFPEQVCVCVQCEGVFHPVEDERIPRQDEAAKADRWLAGIVSDPTSTV